MTFDILLVFFLFIFPVSANVSHLQEKKEALLLEYNLVNSAPKTYYLIIDFDTQRVYLKADANLLRTCEILDSFGNLPSQTTKITLKNHILPYTPEPKTMRRKHPLPLDFYARLTKGPKHRSRLYFSPSFLIQSVGLPAPNNMPSIHLSNQDIKALASALRPLATAIVTPLLTPPKELSQ